MNLKSKGMNKSVFFSLATLVLFASFAISVSAQTAATLPSYEYNPFPYYGTSAAGVPVSQIYFPRVNPQSCEEGEGQDFIIEVLPGSCTPPVVRSDLLEEQGVPVFCKLTSIKVNPLIEIPQVRSINLIGKPPKGVKTILFHPYRAALSQTASYSQLLGSPIDNDLGYAVIVLDRIPNEKDMPDVISANLTARITYDMTSSYGITNDDLVLPALDENDWQNNYKKYSFWDGKGYVRAESIQGKTARIGIYTEATKSLRSFTLQEGQKSALVYMPGLYCSSGLKVELKKVILPQTKATITIDGRRVDVVQGTKILNGKCNVLQLSSTTSGFGGKVSINCPDGSYSLERPSSTAKLLVGGKNLKPEGYKIRDIVLSKVKPSGIGKDNQYISFIGKVLVLEGKEVETLEITVLSSQDKNILSVSKNIGNILSNRAYNNAEELKVLIENVDKGNLQVLMSKEGIMIYGASSGVSIISVDGVVQANYPDIIENYFNLYKTNLDKIVKDFPNEKIQDVEKGEYFGERALWEAALLAESMGKTHDAVRILNNLIEKYPESNYIVQASNKLSSIYTTGDSSQASKIITTSGKTYHVVLEKVEEPSKEELSVDLIVNDELIENVGEKESIERNDTSLWRVEEIKETSAILKRFNNKGQVDKTYTIILGSPESKMDVNLRVKLQDINFKKSAIVAIKPYSRDGETFANFSVHIGIEKRAIKLSVDQTKDLITKLDDKISKLETITTKLGKVVEDWKKVCVVGSAAIWAWNFLDNLQAKSQAIARGFVMREIDMDGYKGWINWCNDPVNWKKEKMAKFGIEGEASSFDNCIAKSRDQIEATIDTGEGVIDGWNERLKDFKKDKDVINKKCAFGGIFCKTSIDQKKLVEKIQFSVFDNYEKEGKLQELTPEQRNVVEGFFTLYNNSYVGLEDAKNLDFEVEMLSQCRKGESGLVSGSPFCEGMYKKLTSRLTVYKESLDQVNRVDGAITKLKKYGVDIIVPHITNDNPAISTPVFKVKDLHKDMKAQLQNPKKGVNIKDEEQVVFFESSLSKTKVQKEGSGIIQALGTYVAVVVPTSNNRFAAVKGKLFKLTNEGIEVEKDEDKLSLLFDRASTFIPRKSCNHKYTSEVVQFWGSGPFRGLPAIMPLGKGFDGSSGWYAATKPYGDSLRSGISNVEAYTEAGEPTHFYISNVGDNGVVNFGTNPSGDDECSQYFSLTETYQGQTTIGGMDKSNTARFVAKAQRCLKEASRAAKTSKGGTIRTECGTFRVGDAKAPTPGLECEDFMDPAKCNLLYNLCDPVICPPSRCDLGGRYPTDNVVQTGIIGSLALCYPNGGNPSEGGVVVPFCLTGVHQGLKNLLSMLNHVRDCLQETIDTGKHVGFCDQMKSVYLCEFFWKELTPFLKTGIPNLVERTVYGRKGGGEYLTFSETYENSIKQVQFFGNYYGQNVLKAIQVRSTAEAGSLICRSFVGLRYPNSANLFDELTRPESPVQINAWFDEKVFSSVTVPPTSHYKVFWHIFAGDDEPAYWNVYLKNPPYTPGLIMPDQYVIQTGYTSQGESIEFSRDFTAPAGYKEICVRVNLKEYCGFKKVTTGFGINELTDNYVSQQTVPTYDVTSEAECTAGTSALLTDEGITAGSMIPFLTQPTFGGLEESLRPSIYKRGIVRICSSENPGKGVETSRWNRVGFCDDDKKISCWLDRESVENSIKDLGILNLTLQNAFNVSTQVFNLTGYYDPAKSKAQILQVNMQRIKKRVNSELDPSKVGTPEGRKEISESVNKLFKEEKVDKLKEVSELSLSKRYKTEAQLNLMTIYGYVLERLVSLSAPASKVSDKPGEILGSGGESVESGPVFIINFSKNNYLVEGTMKNHVSKAFNDVKQSPALKKVVKKLSGTGLSEQKTEEITPKILVVTGYYIWEDSDLALKRAKEVFDYIRKVHGDELKDLKLGITIKDGGRDERKVELSFTECTIESTFTTKTPSPTFGEKWFFGSEGEGLLDLITGGRTYKQSNFFLEEGVTLITTIKEGPTACEGVHAFFEAKPINDASLLSSTQFANWKSLSFESSGVASAPINKGIAWVKWKPKKLGSFKAAAFIPFSQLEPTGILYTEEIVVQNKIKFSYIAETGTSVEKLAKNFYTTKEKLIESNPTFFRDGKVGESNVMFVDLLPQQYEQLDETLRNNLIPPGPIATA